MRKLLLACSLFVASIASLQAQVFADKVVDAGPCDPIIPIFCPGGVLNAQNAVDADPSTFALLKTDLGLVSTAFIELGFSTEIAPGSIVGVRIEESNTILNIDLLETIVVDVLDTAGNIVATKSDFNLTDLNLLLDANESRFIGVPTPDSLDYVIGSVKVTLNGVLSVLNDLKVYAGIAIQPFDACNFTELSNIIETSNVIDEANLVDANPETFAVINLPISLVQNGFIHLGLDEVASGGDYVGFTVEPNNSFLSVGVIQNIIIQGYDSLGNEVFLQENLSIADLVLVANVRSVAQVGYEIPNAATYEVASVKLTFQPTIGILTSIRVFNAFKASNLVSGLDIASTSNFVCSGGTTTLTAEDGFDTYEWSNGESGKSINVSSAGTYSVLATFSNGDCKASGNITLTAQDLLVDFETEAPSCNTADGSITAIVSGGSGDYSYEWSNGSTDSNIVSVPADAYSVTITDNVLGCTFSSNFNLSNVDGPFYTGYVVNSRFNKNDGEIYLSVDASDSVTVNWTDGSTNFVRQGLAPGTYTSKVSNLDNCVSVKSFTILNGRGNGNGNTGGTGNGDSDTASFSITATVTQAGCNQAIGAIDVEVSDAARSFSYSWSNGSANQDIAGLTAGLYTVVVTDIATGEQVDSTFSVNSQNGPAITLNSITEETCTGDKNASISITAGILPATVLWSNGATTNTITNLAPGTYSVEATSIITGCTSYAQYTIVKRNTIQLNLSSTEVTCDPDTMDGTAVADAVGGRMTYSYLWSNGETTPTIENLSAGTYTVIFSDANGCTVEDSVVVELSSLCDDVIDPDPTDTTTVITTRDDVPNVFTPNGDGTNDTWKIVSNPDSYDELSVKVFNRLGDRVFESGAYNNGWRGTYQSTGENLPEGTYFYEIIAAKNGERNLIKGFTVIKR